MKNLCLTDNSTLNPNNKFRKVSPLIEKLNKHCLVQYLPEQTVSIDESMVQYFVRYGCKKFIRNKTVKFGYRCWVADAPLGYAIQFYPYIGKVGKCNPTLGLGESVVSKLAGSLPHQDSLNCQIFMDNSFFSSPLL